MPSVAVQKKPGAAEASIWGLFGETQQAFERLQKRAYELFQQRGGALGRDLDDWFAAERELFNLPASDLTEDEGAIHLKAAVPGMKATDLEVTVTPHELLVRGKADTEQKREEGKTVLSERCHNEIFRRYTLPAEIDAEKAQAKVEDGLLMVDMPKSALRNVPVSEKSKAA